MVGHDHHRGEGPKHVQAPYRDTAAGTAVGVAVSRRVRHDTGRHDLRHLSALGDGG